MTKKMLKIKKKLVSLEMERCQKKIEHKDVTKTDQKIAGVKTAIWDLPRTLRREWYGTTLYAVIFSMILIVSNATNKLVPSLPLPLIQILLGIGWAFFVPEENFHLDTELFLALVIGPLLFREAEEADITSVLKHWRIIFFIWFFQWFLSPPLVWAGQLTPCGWAFL